MPPKSSSMAKTTATASAARTTTKRKAERDVEDSALAAATKRRRQAAFPVRLPNLRDGTTELTARQDANRSVDPDEDDAGFAFTRPAKAKRAAAAAPTRTSPRNLARQQATQATTATGTATAKASAARRSAAHAQATPRATRPPAETAFDGLSTNSDSFVALPVSDTPIIRKNQQLRQQGGGDGRRRSSLSMRGKRASSIGNGFQSLPHSDIPASEFYKHISEDLPEPVRMKQLLAWCARRSIDESRTRPTLHGGETDEQIQAANIARTIEEEVLRDLIENRITTSWYHRPDEPLDALERKPHPQNLNNAAKLREMEERLASLRAEEATWQRLLEAHSISPADAAATTTSTAATTAEASGERFARNLERAVDLDLLPAREAEFVHTLETRDLAEGAEGRHGDAWLREAEANVEFQVDSLLHALHQQQQYLKRAERTGADLLQGAARAMVAAEDRGSRESKARGIGTMDRLRQISRTS